MHNSKTSTNSLSDSNDAYLRKYKKFNTLFISVVIIAATLFFTLYVKNIKPINLPEQEVVATEQNYDSVLYLPKDSETEISISGRVLSDNAVSGYKYILVSEKGDGKVIKYYLSSPNIDLSLSEGFTVILSGKVIDDGRAFEVSSVKLK